MFPNQMQAWNDCVGVGRITNNKIMMMEAGRGVG